MVLGEFILFLVLPSESAQSSSDQSGYLSKESPFYDSDNVDPENPGGGTVTGTLVNFDRRSRELESLSVLGQR